MTGNWRSRGGGGGGARFYAVARAEAAPSESGERRGEVDLGGGGLKAEPPRRGCGSGAELQERVSRRSASGSGRAKHRRRGAGVCAASPFWPANRWIQARGRTWQLCSLRPLPYLRAPLLPAVAPPPSCAARRGMDLQEQGARRAKSLGEPRVVGPPSLGGGPPSMPHLKGTGGRRHFCRAPPRDHCSSFYFKNLVEEGMVIFYRRHFGWSNAHFEIIDKGLEFELDLYSIRSKLCSIDFFQPQVLTLVLFKKKLCEHCQI